MLEKKAEAGHRTLQQASYRLAGALGTGKLAGRHFPIEMRLDRRMPGAEFASFFRLGFAHRTTHRQYLSQREFAGFHSNIIQHRQSMRRLICSCGPASVPKVGITIKRRRSIRQRHNPVCRRLN